MWFKFLKLHREIAGNIVSEESESIFTLYTNQLVYLDLLDITYYTSLYVIPKHMEIGLFLSQRPNCGTLWHMFVRATDLLGIFKTRLKTFLSLTVVCKSIRPCMG